MDLKTFVSETLLQISEGIVEAQKATKTSGTSINPPLYNSSTSRENQINTSNKVNFIPQYIEFDVLVTVENSNTAGGKGNIHIAMFGLDNRSNGNLSQGRSDVIMLANINNDTKEVKLVSVYRDTYLDTGDGIFQKCNAAYAKGGPEQAISMLNVNLDLNITDYVTVDFNSIIECVDLLGGVDMEITDDEASLMTGYILELNELTGNKAENLTQGGTYTLNGVQACAYARIRYGGGDDYRRTERQRTVLTAMVKKAQQSDLTTVNKLINEVCGDIQTSFSNAELLALASQVFQYSIGDTTGFPFTKTTRVLSKKTGDVVIPCDLSDNVKELHIFLYEDSAYTASDTVKQNSEKIVSDTGFKSGDGH